MIAAIIVLITCITIGALVGYVIGDRDGFDEGVEAESEREKREKEK